MMRPLEQIRHIPHFYLIRIVELGLFSYYLNSATPPFLDLGCGDGEFCRSLGLQQVYGIDIDSAALNRLNRDGYYTDVQNAKASAIPYPDEFFGTVFSNCAIEHMDSLPEVLREVERVLIKGGQFVFTVPAPEFFNVVKKDKLLIDVGLADDEVIAKYNLFHHHLNIFTLNEWASLLNTAGFKIASHNRYLPGDFGRFVARMDMLYTFENPETKQLIAKLEQQHNSLAGVIFRWSIRQYLKRLQAVDSGTHFIVEAIKN